MKKLWLIIGCVVVILAFAAGYATMQQTVQREKETLAADVPFVAAIRDGELNGAIGYEWLDATSQEIEIGRFDAVLFAKHDGENLYLGLEIATGERFNSLELYAAFDTNRNGDFFDQGDDILIITLEKGDFVKSEDIDYFYPETYQFALDRDFGGTNNATGVVAVWGEGTEAVYTAEFRKSLTGDAGMDVELRPGDEVDMVIGVIGKASPEVEQVSEPIRIWLEKVILKAVPWRDIGKIRYGGGVYDKKDKKFKEFKIKIRRKGTKTIDIDPNKFVKKRGGVMNFDNVGKKDLVWTRKVDGENILVVDLDSDGTIDLVKDGKGKEWSVGLNKNRIETPRGPNAAISAPKGSVPAGATVTITDKAGGSRTVIANDDGSINLTGLGGLNIAPFDTRTIQVVEPGIISIKFT
jgi:hypothetical protein